MPQASREGMRKDGGEGRAPGYFFGRSAIFFRTRLTLDGPGRYVDVRIKLTAKRGVYRGKGGEKRRVGACIRRTEMYTPPLTKQNAAHRPG